MIAAVLTAGAVLAGMRAVAPPPPDTVAVLVAARDLPSGTVLDEHDLVERDFPAALAPHGASGPAAGRVLAAPVRSGEVLTDVRLVGPGLADAVPGETVLPVRLPDAGMAALLRAGDEVDLLATDPGTGDTAVVARDVTVLATPTGVPDGPAGGAGGALVVVGASESEAIAIAGAALGQFLTVSWSR
jgi:Flp pilus assembly protein CpaB